MDLHNRLLILLLHNTYVKFRVVCTQLQELLGGFGWFWIVSGGFGWFQVVSDGFGQYPMVSDGLLFQQLPFVNTESLLNLSSGLSNIFLKIFVHKPRPAEYFDYHKKDIHPRFNIPFISDFFYHQNKYYKYSQRID